MLAVLRRLLERRAQPFSRRTQLIVTTVTSGALAIVTVWAWRTADLSFSDLNWLAISVAFLAGGSATLWLKMLEYDAAARIIGLSTSRRRAFDVAVVSAAANLLPIPGSLLVTTRSLSEQGAGYGRAALASAIPGLAWLGLAGVVGGPAIVVAGGSVLGAFVTVGGCAGLALTGAMFRRQAPVTGRARLAIRILAIEGSWIAISAFRFWLLLIAIGVSPTPAQSVALAVAGAMSVAIGFFPGGLGIREALIALLSPIISLPLSEGFVLGIVDRIVWLTFLSLAAVAVAAGRARGRAAAGGVASGAGVDQAS